jgi:predicted nucleic acid-binding protein
MRVLVDTNILLRSVQPNHPLCSQATHAVSKLIRQKDAVFFCAQNIAEFWNVATRPADRNGLGRSPEEALQEVSNIEKSLTLLPDAPAIYSAWKQIVTAQIQDKLRPAHYTRTWCSRAARIIWLRLVRL